MVCRRALAFAAVALAFGACAQSAPPPQDPIPTVGQQSEPLAGLPGWAAEDHVAALKAVQAACATSRDRSMDEVCRASAALDLMDEDDARVFLEANFRALPVEGAGRLTGYFMPIYEATRAPSGDFTAPVRPRPADLPPQDFSPSAHAPYAERADIAARPARDALAWMRPEDLFFMQIQGSGVLAFENGAREKAVFAGDNGAPFVGVAAPMRAQGLITDSGGSAEAIHTWLAQHRGEAAEAIMALDPRYVFFSLAGDDGRDPFGAAGQRLIPGRSLAVDPAWHAMGELLWVDGEAPALTGAFPAYRRLGIALDTGGAIKGSARADLYVGRGPAAGLEAGRVRHQLTLWRLVPRDAQ